MRFTNSSGTTRRPGSFSYEAALRSYDHPLSRSDDGNLRSSRETREQTRRCGRSWQKLSGVLSKPADLTRVCVPHLERRSISSTQPLMSSSLHLPSAICHLPSASILSLSKFPASSHLSAPQLQEELPDCSTSSFNTKKEKAFTSQRQHLRQPSPPQSLP
jgi:hypothetical protein